MRVRIALMATLLLTRLAPAGAATIEVPLPELVGTYGMETLHFGQVTTFHLPGSPIVILGASLRVRGTTEVGIIRCDGSGDHPWVSRTEGEMRAGEDQYWIAEARNPPVAGPFETITPFEFLTFSHIPPNWDFLAGGEGTMTFYATPTGTVTDCVTLNPPSVTVTEATLIFDADIPVPTKARSWGRLKVAYR